MIGVQEARTPQGRFHTSHYHIFASGAKVSRAPLFGCEIWVHKTLAVAHNPDGTAITVGDAKFTVQHADPRRLVVEARVAQLQIAFVVLHAPCQGTTSCDGLSPIDAAGHWWQETIDLCRTQVQAQFQWYMVDANASLPEGDGTHIGPLGAEASRPSEFFIQFIHELDLCVPCSFASVHQGQTTTWTHATGKKSRKDSVLISSNLRSLATASCVDVAHDSTFLHEDHLPVTLRCEGWHDVSATCQQFNWHDEAFINPDVCARFRQALQTLPLPAWHVNIDAHTALFERQLLLMGKKFFARPKTKSRRIRLQPATREDIAFKRQCLDLGRKIQPSNENSAFWKSSTGHSGTL